MCGWECWWGSELGEAENEKGKGAWRVLCGVAWQESERHVGVGWGWVLGGWKRTCAVAQGGACQERGVHESEGWGWVWV